MSGGLTRRIHLAMLASAVVVSFLARALQAAKKDPPVTKAERSVYAALAKAPEKAASRRNPFEGDKGAALAGRKLFEEHCAECHASAAEGGSRGPSLRAPEVQQATPGAIFWILSNGVVRRGMPDWSKLPEPERWQLVSFIKSLPDRQANHNPSPHQPPP